MSRRQRRIEDLLRREVSTILRDDLADPRTRLASISRVEVSADLSHAQLFVSQLGDHDQDMAAALEHAAPFIRHRLAQRRKDMKRVPELVFHLDHGAEHSQSIADLLDNLEHERSDP